ncbi:DUF6221 family protein [Streptomyces sp. NPDC055642]
MTDELTQWLRAQLDTDERIARGAGGEWMEFPGTDWVNTAPTTEWRPSGSDHHVAVVVLDSDRAHIVAWDPARVQREIHAKRRILEAHGRLDVGEFCSTCDAPSGIPGRPAGCDTLRLLALPYVNRPGYRQEWRP